MYKTRSKARAAVAEAENGQLELQKKVSTKSQNAARKGVKTGYVVLQRLDSESLNNSLAGETDKKAAGKKSDKPEITTTTKASRRPGKENSEEVATKATKTTRNAAKAQKTETAGPSKAKEDDNKKIPAEKTAKDDRKADVEKVASKAKAESPAKRVLRSRAKSVVADQVDKKTAAAADVEVIAKDPPKQARVQLKPVKEPKDKKIAEKDKKIAEKDKKVAEKDKKTDEILKQDPKQAAEPLKPPNDKKSAKPSNEKPKKAAVSSQNPPKAAAESSKQDPKQIQKVAEAPAGRASRSKTRTDGKAPASRVLRARTVDARPAASQKAFQAVSQVSKVVDSEAQNSEQNKKEVVKAASPLKEVTAKRPRRGRLPSKEAELPTKLTKTADLKKGVEKNAENQREKADSTEKPASKPLLDEKNENPKAPASKTSKKPVKNHEQQVSTKEIPEKSFESSSEASKRPKRKKFEVEESHKISPAPKSPLAIDQNLKPSVEGFLKRNAEASKIPKQVESLRNDLPAKSSSEMAEDEDPYSFNLSQSEPAAKKAKNTSKAKKRAAKPKPGNKMELLMQKKKLEAVGSSCNVQQNPVRYEAERTQLQKQLDVSTSAAPIFNVEDQPAKKAPNSSVAASKRASSFFIDLKPKPAPKVVHSPKPVLALATESPEPFVSDSPPIRSKYAVQMAQIAQKQVAKSTPFRVTGNLPSPFYMQLSGNDGTPSYSSDLVERRQERVAKNDEEENREENHVDPESSSETCRQSPEEQVQASPSTTEAEIVSDIAEVLQKSRTILEDSNAENIAPENAPKKAKKIQQASQTRSPLKALPISALAHLPSTVTLRKNADVKKAIESNSAILNREESTNFDESANFDDQSSRDSFGFDELLEAGKQSQAAGPSAGPSSSKSDYRAKVENIKQYLPSKNNKSRDKNIFPTSPVKHIELLHSPMKKSTTNIQKFMASSTPVVNRPKLSATFGETFDLTENKEAGDETAADEASSLELFDESQEMAFAQRSYSRPKRLPAFLRAVEELESESEDEATKANKAPTRSKRKKFDIEETGEFKKFVHDKSAEFAEVDDYQMVIE